MVNRSEEKVRVHMNVVPRSTMNTNGGTENLRANLTINTQWALALVKGTTRGKETTF